MYIAAQNNIQSFTIDSKTYEEQLGLNNSLVTAEIGFDSRGY